MNEVGSLDSCLTECVHPEKVALVQAKALDDNDLGSVAMVFKLLGDLTRTRLLYALLDAGELCVCDLAAATGTSEPAVSQALRLLRACDVVSGRREGRMVFYRLADAHVRMLLDLTREHVHHDRRPRERAARARVRIGTGEPR